MTNCWRHFKALTKKNAILWYRRPGCASCEILAPVFLMAILCIMRVLVPLAHTDQAGMLAKNTVIFPALPYEDGVWADSTEDNYILNELSRPLITYGNYKGDFQEPPKDYHLEYDDRGPQFFYPLQCMKQFDYQKGNPQESRYIGIIGAQSNITDSTAQYFVSYIKALFSGSKVLYMPQFEVRNFTNADEMNDYISSPEYKTNQTYSGVCMAIEHHIDEDNPNNYTFSMHFPDQAYGGFFSTKFSIAIPNQSKPVWNAYQSSPDLFSYYRYQHNGYGNQQNLMANQILIDQTDDPNAFIMLMYQPVQTDTTVYDPIFIQVLQVLLPLFILIGFIPPVYNMVFKIVREKETRTKETMRIMGMTDVPYWLSWFVQYTIINTIVVFLSWGALMINVINFSSPFYIFIFFWLYGEAVFGQILFLQSLFTGSKYAGIVATIVYFVGFFINHFLVSDNLTSAGKLAASILPQVALIQGATVFANYEGNGIGINSSNCDFVYQNYSFNYALGMLFFDFILFTGLGLYLDKIIPSEFGQRLSPFFLCTPSYYRCCRTQNHRRQVSHSADSEHGEAEIDNEFERHQMEAQNYEGPLAICKRQEATGDYLRVQNLHKTFSGGFQAVRGVSVKMFDSQIFALLGHNGAGKTTVISMLTGLIDKTEGDAKCYDVDMFGEMDEVREFMGLCPQHDVLFDLLTPREHLEIFYDFKGGDPAHKEREINALIEDVGLDIDQNKISKMLSGGTKRKTSVCIALCGGSKLVLLDEPTSGMDLGARRSLWDMLKSYKKDRIIILTTHHMDEADVLGDRIGIMVQGQLKCIGSPLFLKNRFGIGYRITFVKKSKNQHPDLERYLQSYFQGLQKAGEIHDEVSFVIPKSQSNNLGGFFENLDKRLDDFDISSYGVSMSNLEDVFLKINKEYAPDLFKDLKGLESSPNSSQSSISVSKNFANSIGHSDTAGENKSADVTNSLLNKDSELQEENDKTNKENVENLIRGSSCARSCTASSAKRFIIYKRDWCGLLCQVVIPIVFVLFGAWITSGPTKLHQSPPRPLSTGLYPYKQRIVMNNIPVNMTGDGNDIMGSDLFAMLPNATDAFEVTYKDNLNYTEFYDAVYAARKDGPPFPYRFGSYQVFKANKAENNYQFVQYMNNTSQDVAGLYPQYFYTAILRAATGQPDLEYNIITKPFPIYEMFKEQEKASRATDFIFMMAISLALIPCVMIEFILNERENHLKHQQLLSGMSLAGYWVSNLVFDILMAYVPISLIMLLMFAFGKWYDGAWVLLLLFPPAVVPWTYVTSFFFKSDITAQICTLIIHFLFGAVAAAALFAMQQIPILMPAGDALRWVFCIVPSFCVTHGFLWSASGDLVRQTRDGRDDTGSPDFIPIPRQLPAQLWAWYNLKGDAVILVLHFFVSLFILAIIELEVSKHLWWCPRLSCRNCKSKERRGPVLIKDDDVIAEEERVAKQRGDNKDCIRVNKFQKIYEPSFQHPITAVRQASFGLNYGDCFALLGVNGAGKSTTFKSLTRQIVPTKGEISIQGYNVQSEFTEARKLMGYCPQHEALFQRLTVQESLKFYALIKGIRTHQIDEVVEKTITDLNLKDHRDKCAGTLSGGNKRKLQVALAILGNPPIILLDEPSAGMDPEARRFMWQVLQKLSLRDKNSAVILTTHSMEEAEALSTKLGIMVRGGVFRCMGSMQHIKNKFGTGYEVEIKVNKASYDELQSMAQRLELSTDLQQKVNLLQAITKSHGQFEPQVIEQIRKDGLGSELILESELDPQRKEVRLRNLLEYLSAQDSGFKIINWMCRNFKQVEMLEQCGEFFKLRVPKEEKTIGWLFGQLEHEKHRLGIQEYNVSQTTLEQIFQNFANQSISSDRAAFTFRLQGDRLILVNADRKMTEEQERLSQRGLSFNESTPMTQPPDLGDGGISDDEQPSSSLLPKTD